jgi:hypothetical protein
VPVLTGELILVTDESGLLRRRYRAVTLIEAVLYISVALALIVGGLVFFQQASTAARTSTTVRQMSAILAEVRVLLKGIPLEELPVAMSSNMTSYFISAGAVPPDMVIDPNTLSNPFGGNTTFGAGLFFGQPYIGINLTNVPQEVCVRLLTATSGSDYVRGSGVGATTRVSNGYMLGGGAAPDQPQWSREYTMNATQAGWMCKYGAINYTNKTTQPTTPPISGNVNVTMVFLVNA